MTVKQTGTHRLYAATAAIALSVVSLASAATIDVPADQATIQGAINAASPGDTIIVAPGTYNEAININQAGLTILSSAGRDMTTIENAPGAANPVVRISAPATMLGAADQGFTIRHLDASPNRVIHIDSDAIGFPGVANAEPTTIAGNQIEANQASRGIYSDSALAEVLLNIEGNVFAKSGGGYSFVTAMHFDYTNVGSVGNAALYTATLNILNNVVDDLNNEAIYFGNDVYTSDILIDGNTFNGPGSGSGYGFYCNNYLYDLTTLSFTNNTVNDMDYGFYMYEAEDNSALHVDDNTISDFSKYGVYVEYVYYGGDLSINNNTIAGDGTADYGIYVYDYDEGCTGQIKNNHISDVDYAGIYQEYIYYSIVDVTGNTIEGNSADYGIYHYYCEAALFDVLDNDVSGYDNYGLYVDDYLEYGGIYRFNDNTFEGDGTGSGVYFADYFEYGPYVEVSGNTISAFDSYGIYIYELYEGGTCKVNSNSLTAAGGGAATTGISWEYIESGGGSGEVIGNTIDLNGSAYDGLYFYHMNYGADLLVDGNTVSGYQRYGLYFDDALEEGASCTITNNLFHADPATGSEAGVYISDYVESGSDLVVSTNDIKDFFDYGIYVYSAYTGGTAQIDGNTLSARPNPAMGYGIYVEYTEYGGDTFIRDNMIDVNNAPYDAMYLYYVGDGSGVTITGNACVDYQEAGLYVDDYIENGSSLIVDNNSFMPAEGIPSIYGIYVSDYVEYGSYFECIGNDISGFTDDGIYTSYIYDGSDIVCDDNIITGDADGADYGIYIANEIEYGNFGSSISNNTITNVKDDGGNMAGIYIYELYESAFVDVFENTITAHPDGASYGVEVEYVDNGNTLDLARNSVTGFSEAAFYFDDYINDGSIVKLRNNNALGGKYSIVLHGYIDNGVELSIEKNNLHGFTEYGVHFNDYVHASLVDIDRNLFDGDDPAAVGIRTFSDLDEGAVLSVNDNCFKNLADGVVVYDILETAIATLRGNDFSGVSGDAVVNENGDADHAVDAMQNFLDGVGTSGHVDVASELTTIPDLDGDGVPNCSDLCPDTEEGVAVDADGCPLPTADDNMNDNGNGEGPAPAPAPNCGCGNGGVLMMPFAAIGFAGVRRRRRNRRKACA